MASVLEGSFSTDTYKYMQCAIEQAKLALDALEVPVGCVVVVESGEIIATGRNRTTETRNATRHAEMEAIDDLLCIWRKNGLTPAEVAEKFSNCSLYVTCEPCIMCAGALSILGFKEVYFGCGNDKFGGCRSVLSIHSSSFHSPERLNFMTKHHSFNLPSGVKTLYIYKDDVRFVYSRGDGEASVKKGFKCTGGIMADEAVSLFRSFYEQGNLNAPKHHRPVLHPMSH